MQETRCHFIIAEDRCMNQKEPFSPFCSEHKDYFSDLDNKALVEMAAKYMRECVYVAENKKISAKMDKKAWANFTNCMNELSARGYSFEEAGGSLSRLIKQKGFFDDIFEAIGHNPKWKKFEKVVAGIHKLKAEGARVKYDDHIMGRRTGRKRQIDVSLRFDHGYYQYLVVIECKDLKSKVRIDAVESLCTKLEDIGAHKGVMVSTRGFQKGAIGAAKAHNVDLFTLTEEMGDWTEKITNNVINLPMPTSIRFDHPSIERPPEDIREPVKFDEIHFFEQEKKPPITLLKMLIDVCGWADEAKVELPCTVNLRFSKDLFCKFPGADKYVPMYGMKIRLVSYQHKITQKINLAPKVEKYVYSDLNKEKVYEIPSDKIGV